MKKYGSTLIKTFFYMTFPVIILAAIVVRVADVRLSYLLLTIGTLIMSLFIALAIRVFKMEKGNPIINAILGYIIIIPALLTLRNMFGEYIFRRVYIIYIVIAIIGIIYAIALWVASKKYQDEVKELNRLLLDKTDDGELDTEEPEEVQ